jgi:hypothetical protein
MYESPLLATGEAAGVSRVSAPKAGKLRGKARVWGKYEFSAARRQLKFINFVQNACFCG